MKKSLLFAAALFACTAVNAQKVLWTCETATSDGKNIKEADYTLDGTVTGSTTIKAKAITVGTGLNFPPTTCPKSHKAASGTSFQYGSDETPAIIKWVPSVPAEEAIKDLDAAYGAGQYTEFAIEESDESKTLQIASISFGAVRLGTDAVRVNAKLIDNSGSGYESDWLINENNWATVSDGTGSYEVATGAEGEIPGCQPSREDASKPNSCEAGITNYNIPVPADFPADAYDVTLRLVVYGVGNNKAIAYHNVAFNLGTDTGINEVATSTKNANAPMFNMAGQRVSNNFKGLMIQNGKKFINK